MRLLNIYFCLFSWFCEKSTIFHWIGPKGSTKLNTKYLTFRAEPFLFVFLGWWILLFDRPIKKKNKNNVNPRSNFTLIYSLSYLLNIKKSWNWKKENIHISYISFPEWKFYKLIFRVMWRTTFIVCSTYVEHLEERLRLMGFKFSY